MSITRTVRLIQANDPDYILEVSYQINDTSYLYQVRYTFDRRMGRFYFGELENFINNLHNPNVEMNFIKRTIESVIDDYLIDN